jgi:hypothetical protein
MEYLTQYYKNLCEQLQERINLLEAKVKKKKKANKDYDGDGKVESSTDEWKGSRDRAIKQAMNEGLLSEAGYRRAMRGTDEDRRKEILRQAVRQRQTGMVDQFGDAASIQRGLGLREPKLGQPWYKTMDSYAIDDAQNAMVKPGDMFKVTRPMEGDSEAAIEAGMPEDEFRGIATAEAMRKIAPRTSQKSENLVKNIKNLADARGAPILSGGLPQSYARYAKPGSTEQLTLTSTGDEVGEYNDVEFEDQHGGVWAAFNRYDSEYDKSRSPRNVETFTSAPRAFGSTQRKVGRNAAGKPVLDPTIRDTPVSITLQGHGTAHDYDINYVGQRDMDRDGDIDGADAAQRMAMLAQRNGWNR